MGNNPSSQASGHREKSSPQTVNQHLQALQQRSAAASALAASAAADNSRRANPSGARMPPSLPITPQGIAAPPTASLLQATGSSAATPMPMSADPHTPSAPMDVPGSAVDRPGSYRPQRYQQSVTTPDMMPMMSAPSMTDVSSYLARPPRLPLRIEEEEHAPGSPVLPPAMGEPVEGPSDGIESDPSTAKSSTSNVPAQGHPPAHDKNRTMVPIKLVWRQGGERVYVTGTPFQWNRKLRMQPVHGKPGVFSVTIPMLPGTHHIRFLVDNKMRTSDHLPTTVDFGNNLVNYIEASTDSVTRTRSKSQSAAAKAGTAPLTTATTPTPGHPARAPTAIVDSNASRPPRAMRQHKLPSRDEYRVEIPRYLKDFDMPEDSEEYMYAVAAIEKLTSPPALPGFLGKPILNASASVKDDNSVLVMPNHSVLNHLATISIKNGVLGVCATTRYRYKYVTTIIYKPTNPEEG